MIIVRNRKIYVNDKISRGQKGGNSYVMQTS